MTTITLGILTKNSGAQLEPLLSQCKDYANEIIVIDGFSSDNTCEIASKYGAKIYKRAFNGSFADMRNELIALASSEYILMLDSDETLEDVNKVFNDIYTHTVYAFPRHNFKDYTYLPAPYPDYQTRLIKVAAGIQYNNAIHETINAPPIILDTHIIHDKHSEYTNINYFNCISACKNKSSNWIEYIDIMDVPISGAYDPEYFNNGDVSRWLSGNASATFICNSPEASGLEIKISTFGTYDSVDLELFIHGDSVGKLLNINKSGTYIIPLNSYIIDAPAEVTLVVTGNNNNNLLDPRDLCIFVDYVAFISNYMSGILKLTWDESKKYLMHGFSYDEAIMTCICQSGWWETDNLACMHKLIRPDFVCLDVGANIGALSIPMSALCDKLYAFEAGFEIYGMLKSNIIDNSITNIEPLYLAVSNKKDIVYFHHNTGNVGGSYVTPLIDSTSTSAVHAIRLDTWAKNKLDRLDFIKCDIEGFEVKFLRGAKQTIKKYKPILLIEFNPVAYSNNSTDDTIEDLWNELTSLYSYIYVIEGADVLRRVHTLEQACQRIDYTTRTLEDLLCMTSEI